MTGDGKVDGRVERQARLRWVPLTQMRVNPLAQRDLNQARVSKLAAVFEPEKMDAPTVSHRGGWYYLIDGQHRIAALKAVAVLLAGSAGPVLDLRGPFRGRGSREVPGPQRHPSGARVREVQGLGPGRPRRGS
jgi:ParB-like nuclease domain